MLGVALMYDERAKLESQTLAGRRHGNQIDSEIPERLMLSESPMVAACQQAYQQNGVAARKGEARTGTVCCDGTAGRRASRAASMEGDDAHRASAPHGFRFDIGIEPSSHPPFHPQLRETNCALADSGMIAQSLVAPEMIWLIAKHRQVVVASRLTCRRSTVWFFARPGPSHSDESPRLDSATCRCPLHPEAGAAHWRSGRQAHGRVGRLCPAGAGNWSPT